MHSKANHTQFPKDRIKEVLIFLKHDKGAKQKDVYKYIYKKIETNNCEVTASRSLIIIHPLKEQKVSQRALHIPLIITHIQHSDDFINLFSLDCDFSFNCF